VNVTDSEFLNNTAFLNMTKSELSQAHAGYAGALMLDCNDFTNCDLGIYSNNCTNCRATKNGGCIAWMTRMPKGLETMEYNQCNAPYGKNVSSYPIKVAKIGNDGKIEKRRQLGFSFSDVAPGLEG
jgi:hypothetical protein